MLTSKQTDNAKSTSDELEDLNNHRSEVRVLDYPVDLSILDSMLQSELHALCARLLCQCGLAATMTEEQTAQAMIDLLAETALRPISPGLNMKADIQSRLNAIDKWLDRKKGKAIQSIDMNVRDTRMDKLEIDKLIRLASMLDDPVIIPPMPSKE